ncbi:type III pantothenate kinase [Flavobacteriaceae bacterium M23B6Z8]
MNLIIDVGNTQTKIAVFNKNKLIFETAFKSSESAETIKDVLEHYPCSHAIVSSVTDKTIQQILESYQFSTLIDLTAATPVPFANEYSTPETLGVDRIALAAAAYKEYPGHDTLIIDAGTCITFDFINSKGKYMGGAIAPGLQMRYTSLNRNTAKLPLIDKDQIPENIIGDSTENAILSGVYFGMIHEIEGAISHYKSLFEHLTVILTGGDMQILSKTLKNTIFANPKFLIRGLNHILEYNKHE